MSWPSETYNYDPSTQLAGLQCDYRVQGQLGVHSEATSTKENNLRRHKWFSVSLCRAAPGGDASMPGQNSLVLCGMDRLQEVGDPGSLTSEEPPALLPACKLKLQLLLWPGPSLSIHPSCTLCPVPRLSQCFLPCSNFPPLRSPRAQGERLSNCRLPQPCMQAFLVTKSV